MTERVIYYTANDCGDGSMSVEFFDSQECIDVLEEHDPESYRGEGGGSFTVEGTIKGIQIQTTVDVLAQLALEEEDLEDEQ